MTPLKRVPSSKAAAFDNNVHAQVCLNAPACERAWIYERALGYMLEGHDDRVIGEVTEKSNQGLLHID